MPKHTIKIGQLGIGYWGPNLLRNIVSRSDCEMVTVADLSEERRNYVTQKYPNITTTTNPQEIFENPDIDAVIISTPAKTHFHLARTALSHGKHVLVEKPPATSVEEVDELSELSRTMQRVCMVGHTFVYSPAVQTLKTLIESGSLGQVRYLYSQRLNLGRIRSDIDVVWNLAPHDISIVQYLFGDPLPISIHRSGMAYVQRGIEDVAFLSIKYPNNLLVNIHVSWLDPTRSRKMVIVGSERMAVYDDTQEHKIQLFDKGIDRMAVLGTSMDFDEPSAKIFSHREGAAEIVPSANTEPLQLEIQHFLDCIRNKVPCRTSASMTRRIVEILCRAQIETKFYDLHNTSNVISEKPPTTIGIASTEDKTHIGKTS